MCVAGKYNVVDLDMRVCLASSCPTMTMTGDGWEEGGNVNPEARLKFDELLRRYRDLVFVR